MYAFGYATLTVWCFEWSAYGRRRGEHAPLRAGATAYVLVGLLAIALLAVTLGANGVVFSVADSLAFTRDARGGRPCEVVWRRGRTVGVRNGVVAEAAPRVTAGDPAKRREIIRETVQYMMEHQYGIGLFTQVRYKAWHPVLKNFQPNWNILVPPLMEAWLDR